MLAAVPFGEAQGGKARHVKELRNLGRREVQMPCRYETNKSAVSEQPVPGDCFLDPTRLAYRAADENIK
jgi:hypothetical protein